jgi:uncharacterized protein YqfA (UPF0365 family)
VGVLAKLDILTTVSLAVAALVIVVVLWRLLGLYVRARLCGVPVSLPELAGMWLHRLDAQTIVNALVMTEREGLGISAADLQAHALSGGDVQRVVGAMIIARRANVEMTWHKAATLDLMGGDALKNVLDRIPKAATS